MKKIILYVLIFSHILNHLDASWSTAQLINNSTQSSNDANYVRISHDPFGNAACVWIENDGSDDWVKTSTYNYNVGWTDAHFFSPQYSSRDYYDQVISHNKFGDAICILPSFNGVSNYTVAAQHYNYATNNWSASGTIGFGGTTRWTDFDMKHDVFGNAIVVFISYAAGNYGVDYLYHDHNTSDWSSSVPLGLSSSSPNIARNPKISFDSSGNAICVWEEWDGVSKYVIKAAHYTHGFGGSGSWGVAATISPATHSCTKPEIEHTPEGVAHCVYGASDGVNSFIGWSFYIPSPGPGWAYSSFLDATSHGGFSYLPKIASDVLGNLICVWRESSGSSHSVKAIRFTYPTGWDSSSETIGNDINSVCGPRISMDIFGNAICAWYTSGSTYDAVTVARYVNGFGWKSAEAINNPNQDGHALTTEISHDPWGNAILVWEETVGGVRKIKYSHYMHDQDDDFHIQNNNFQSEINSLEALYNAINRRVLILEGLVSQRPIVRRDAQDYFEEETNGEGGE